MPDLISGAVDLPPLILSNNTEWNEVFDLAGFTATDYLRARAYMQLRASPADIAVLVDLSSPAGGIVLDAVDSTLHIFVPGPAMRLLPPGTYVRDIVITENVREVLFAGRGVITIVQGVTQIPEAPTWPL